MAAYVIAAGLAMLVAGVELRGRLASRPTLRSGAWMWWGFRLALDGAIGLAAVTIIGTVGRPEWLTGLTAGLAGSAFVRWQVAIPGSDGQLHEIGVAKAYDPLRNYFESVIAEIGAVQQQEWISGTVLPVINEASMTVADLGGRLHLYVDAMTGLDPTSKSKTLDFISETVRDTATDDEKVRVLVLHAINELHGYRVVRHWVKAARKRTTIVDVRGRDSIAGAGVTTPSPPARRDV